MQYSSVTKPEIFCQIALWSWNFAPKQFQQKRFFQNHVTIFNIVEEKTLYMYLCLWRRNSTIFIIYIKHIFTACLVMKLSIICWIDDILIRNICGLHQWCPLVSQSQKIFFYLFLKGPKWMRKLSSIHILEQNQKCFAIGRLRGIIAEMFTNNSAI